MRNISDIIENYLKQVLEISEQETVEIKRNEIADKFQCVPSQINYVINTRFTMEKGYVVESKRGGGGYIRIMRVEVHGDIQLIDHLLQMIQNEITFTNAEAIVERIYNKGIISKREGRIILSTIDKALLNVAGDKADKLRAKILQAILTELKYK